MLPLGVLSASDVGNTVFSSFHKTVLGLLSWVMWPWTAIFAWIVFEIRGPNDSKMFRCSDRRSERFWSCRKLSGEPEIRKFLPRSDWYKRHQVPCQERGIVTDTMAKGQRIVSYCIFWQVLPTNDWACHYTSPLEAVMNFKTILRNCTFHIGDWVGKDYSPLSTLPGSLVPLQSHERRGLARTRQDGKS
jgi:hypothetical protein